MSRLFQHKTYPALCRDLFGFSFKLPVALEPTPPYKFGRWAAGTGRFAFIELGPFDCSGQIAKLPRPASTVLAANISCMDGTTAAELTQSVGNTFSALYDYADMFVLDTFRPDSAGVVALQNADSLSEVLDSLLENRRFYDSSKPILVRVSPAISQPALEDMVHYLRMCGADGIIAGHDTFCPELVSRIFAITRGRFPLVACGGAGTPARVEELLAAGADMVQVPRFRSKKIIHSLEKAQKQTHQNL